MAQKETAAQRRARIEMLLADFANRSEELRKLTKIVDGLKEQIKEIPEGKYGEWMRSSGTPREMLDQTAVKAFYAKHGEPLPTKMSAAPALVRPVAGAK